MVKLIEVDAADIPTDRQGRRGRVSYPLLKSFLESKIRIAKIDLTGLEKNPAYLRSVLYSYVRTHKLPIKIFSANGDLHLMRLDMDAKGKVDANWKPEEETPTEGNAGALRGVAAIPIDAIEVERRFKQEAPKTTK